MGFVDANVKGILDNKKLVETAEKAFLDAADATKRSGDYGGPLPYAKWGEWLPS